MIQKKKIKGKRTLKRKITNKKKKDNESLNQSFTSNFSNNSEILNKKEKKQKLDDFKLKIKKIIDETKNECKECTTIHKVLDHLEKKLFEPIINNIDNLFGDFTAIFQDGILTHNILIQNKLILKNLPNLSPAVLERFNDLFNYNPKLSLNEDFCNTFTGIYKEWDDFSSIFRTIAICQNDNLRNLSDAAKSRFSILYTSKYNDDERKAVSKLYYPDISNNFIQFFEEYKKVFKKELEFPLIIKILSITQILDEKNINNKDKNLLLSIYKAIYPLMKSKKKKNELISIIKKICPNDYEFFNENSEYDNKCPFIFDNNLHSLYTGLRINIADIEESNTNNYTFTKPFNKILDSIHFSYLTNYPLIIEGGTGLGKKTAINYFLECLKINKENVIQIQLSNSTTLDNLFCKKIPDNSKNTLEFIEEKSKFLLAIDENTSNNDIIILENLEQASITILEALIPIFNINSKEQILLPNGKYIKKGLFKLIATFDPTVKGSILNILPEAIKNNAILFSVPNYSKEDYKNICKNIFINEEKKKNEKEKEEEKKEEDKKEEEKIEEKYNDEIEQFINDIVKIQNYIYKNQLKEIISLNDIYKFYLLKNEVQNIFEYDLIAKILFIQRFSNLNEMENITKELGYKYDDLWPEFFYGENEEEIENEENKNEYLCVAPFEAEEQIKIKIKGESKEIKINKI